MTIAQTKERIYTPEEYLELEIASDTRNEYRNGEIIPMTGGMPNHNEITSIFNAILRLKLKGKPYSIFSSDQRLWIPEANLYTYPDIMVVPKPIELQTGRKDTVTNPCFIAEVLSKSTQNYDRSEKFVAYRTIPSFGEYLLVSQYSVRVEHYVKTAPDRWLLSEYTDPSTILTLNSFDLQLAIADLYENIDFEDG
ncbi:Uma2 family endonuclease [Chamaesiphon sp. VAR_48_metabat_403]|uniref:Uma2 family endonuclease n=1 Tax=Chamaesiphon sp. VAR_48_metabat_403 TaxID=2964700 RepID=UPI00286DF455|nr:Uma2 family endonuclease [Chamaesiphon sp. VAR_48_metabat_403]